MAQYVARAAGQGADVVLDGCGVTVEGPENGHWMGISLLDRVSADSDAYRNEIFGPVLCVLRSKTYEDAMNIVNGSPFGNAGAVFTRNGGTARRFQLEVEVGRVCVNMPMPLRVGNHSFGGWKDSAFGEHRMYGSEVVHFYTRGKVITSRRPDPAETASGPDLSFRVPR